MSKMQFRTPEGKTPIRVALLSGHVAIIPHEWRELPEIFHEQAVREGAERSDGLGVPVSRPVQAGAGAMNQVVSDDAHIRDAITKMLLRAVDEDFSGDGLPNLDAVSKLAGFSATKENVLRVFRAMKQEAGVTTEAVTKTAEPPAQQKKGSKAS